MAIQRKSNYIYITIIAILLSVDYGCKTSSDEASEAEKVDQNMFGQGIPRGLTITNEGLTPGYLMYGVTNSGSIYLVNRMGEVVHEWKSNNSIHVLSGYLWDDGSIYHNAHDPDFPVFEGGGSCGRIQRISWDGEMLWDFEFANEEHHAHHDFEVLPNGNILTIAWEVIPAEIVQSSGRKTDQIPRAGLWPDMLVEIEPQGKKDGKIVWEWHVWDHIVQDTDPALRNYGNPADHPELLDVNLGKEVQPRISEDSIEVLRSEKKWDRVESLDKQGSDVFHVNAVDYNPSLDQIAFSSYQLNEIFIIDHSTTTKEAASHEGGRQGKGGDFLYRWGNPQNYQRGDSTDQVTFKQHDIKWIEANKPGSGNLTLFNNNIPGAQDSLHYSAVLEIAPPMDSDGNYVLERDKPFGPQTPTWIYTAPDSISFFSSFISGAHRMKNGNTLITEGARGRSFEVTQAGEIVWEFLNPYRGNVRKLNGDENRAEPMTWSIFRSTFVSADHPALKDRELISLDPQPEVFDVPVQPQD